MWQRSGWWWRAFWWWVRPEAGSKVLEVGDCQVMVMFYYLKFLELLCMFCVCADLHLVFFSIWNFLFCLCCEEMILILRGPVPVLPGFWSSSCSPFMVYLTVPSFLLPRTSVLFYCSTDYVFLGVFLPSLPDCDILEQMVYIWLISSFA